MREYSQDKSYDRATNNADSKHNNGTDDHDRSQSYDHPKESY